LRGALDSLLEPHRVNGLEQVIDRVHLEGLNRVLVEGRDENQGRRLLVSFEQTPGDLESAQAWHLDIEKHQVRLVTLHRCDRLGTVTRLRHDLDDVRHTDPAQAGSRGSSRASCSVVNDHYAHATTHELPATARVMQ
jgi:hypothetical protein